MQVGSYSVERTVERYGPVNVYVAWVAADSDTATSGYNPKTNIFPNVRLVTSDGIHEIAEADLAKAYRSEA